MWGEALAQDAILEHTTAHVGDIEVGCKQIWHGARVAVLSTPELDLRMKQQMGTIIFLATTAMLTYSQDTLSK